MADRKAIRQTLVELLLGQTAAGTRVGSSRAKPVWRENLPALQVYVAREDAEEYNQAPLEYRVRTSVAIELFVEESAAGPADDKLDDLIAEVLAVLWKNPTLGIKDCDHRLETIETDFEGKGRTRLGGGRITLAVRHYLAAPEEEEGELGRYELLHAETDLAPPDGRRESIDDVDVNP